MSWLHQNNRSGSVVWGVFSLTTGASAPGYQGNSLRDRLALECDYQQKRYDPAHLSGRLDKLPALLDRLDQALSGHSTALAPPAAKRISTWQIDAAALRFHLTEPSTSPITVIVGGTGTGKSTLVNRLVGHTVTAASYRRTFTSGPVAVVSNANDLPANWLGVEHIPAAADQPPRGQSGAVTIVIDPQTPAPVVDTPDLDGDQPANHVQADRAFRWGHRIIFVVTPEKYQMIELIPYYRLARRYELAALFVMNKCEEPAVLDDFLRQLSQRDWADAHVFAIPRDDAAYEPPADENLVALRQQLTEAPPPTSSAGIRNRVTDVVSRLTDQVLSPLREARKEADQLCAALRAMESPAAGVDVNPIAEELRRLAAAQRALPGRSAARAGSRSAGAHPAGAPARAQPGTG